MTDERPGTPCDSVLERAVDNLSKAVRFETISYDDASNEDIGEFKSFHAFLGDAYPLVHSHLEKEVVGEASLLYTWPGGGPEARPVVLAAHIDVVPVEPGTLADWTHPPFEGVTADSCIWGRGTMDCKGQLIAIMEAVESLLAEGYAPDRTVYLAFGQDEEVGGHRGAEKIADLLKSRDANPELVIDEGGVLVDLGIPGFKRPIATVGIAEKGYLTLELKVLTEGGHASMPPRHTAIGVLAQAIHRLEEHPPPARIGDITSETFAHLMPELPLYLRIALGNSRVTGMLMKAASSRVNAVNAMLRTTTAVTMIQGGTKDNVLPQEATATVNMRIMPGESIESAVSRTKRVINDLKVEVSIAGEASNPTRASRLDSRGFRMLDRTIKETVPESVIVPYLVLGMTDSRHYAQISDAVFRFCPIRVGKEDQELAHGTDERIKVDNFGEFIEFYGRLIRNSSTAET